MRHHHSTPPPAGAGKPTLRPPTVFRGGVSRLLYGAVVTSGTTETGRRWRTRPTLLPGTRKAQNCLFKSCIWNGASDSLVVFAFFSLMSVL